MKKVKNILMLIAAFILGMLVCFFCFFDKNNEKKNNEELILNILKEENNDLSCKVDRLLWLFTREGVVDTTVQEFILLKSMNLISNYFKTILSSEKKYSSFSLDTIKSITEDSITYVYIGNFYETAEKILPKKNTPIENEWYINLCFNIILNRCFEEYKRYSLTMRWGDEECLFVPKKDTVKIGEFYEADIYFSIKDLTRTYSLNFEDGTIFKGDIYKEKTITKGLNTRKGELYFFNGEMNIGFPFEFSFYVK